MLGSTLAYICCRDGPGEHQTVQPWKRLALLFEQIQVFYTEHRTETRLTNLKLSMFTKVKSPHSEYAFLNAKGSECKHLAPALLWVCRQVLDASDPVDQHIVRCLEGLTGVVQIFDNAGPFLTNTEYEAALGKAEQHLVCYDWLNKWAVENERMLFHIVIKHHTFLHLA